MQIEKLTLLMTLAGALLLSFTACQKPQQEDLHDSLQEVKIVVHAPSTLSQPTLLTLEASIAKDDKVTECSVSGNEISAELARGQYTLTAKATYKIQGGANPIVIPHSSTFEVLGGKDLATFDIHLMYAPQGDKKGLIFSEIFFAGTLNSDKKQYNDDKYIIIVNSSLTTPQYLDGLVFVRSGHVSNWKYNAKPKPDIENTLLVDLALQFPGRGTDHPVKPGDRIVICQSAINHSKYNPNSADLSIADFEWVDDKSASQHDMPNNPAVPDLLPLYTNDSKGDFGWSMNNDGGPGYGLIRPGWTDAASYINNPANIQRWRYDVVVGPNHLPNVPGDPFLKIPNGWIVDFVTTGTKQEKEWEIVSPLVDAGMACVADKFNSNSRYFLAVKRKVNGKGEWVDTNDSSNDFEAVKATLLP